MTQQLFPEHLLCTRHCSVLGTQQSGTEQRTHCCLTFCWGEVSWRPFIPVERGAEPQEHALWSAPTDLAESGRAVRSGRASELTDGEARGWGRGVQRLNRLFPLFYVSSKISEIIIGGQVGETAPESDCLSPHFRRGVRVRANQRERRAARGLPVEHSILQRQGSDKVCGAESELTWLHGRLTPQPQASLRSRPQEALTGGTRKGPKQQASGVGGWGSQARGLSHGG